MIIATEYEGQSSILLFPTRLLLEKHLNILQSFFFFFNLLHTAGATSPPLLLAISTERKDHEMEIVGRVISRCEFPVPPWKRSHPRSKRNHPTADIDPESWPFQGDDFHLKLDTQTRSALPATLDAGSASGSPLEGRSPKHCWTALESVKLNLAGLWMGIGHFSSCY